MKKQNLLKEIRNTAAAKDLSKDLLEPLLLWFDKLDINAFYRLNAFYLADQLKVDRNELLSFLIKLTGVGLFDINWDYHCPQCNGISETHNNLNAAKEEGQCKICNIDFRNVLDRNIEVTFTPSEKYITIPMDYIKGKMNEMMELTKKKEYELSDPFVSGLDCLHIPAFKEIFEDDVLSFNESLAIKNICIMFTDVKGSTELYELLGDARAYRLIREHFNIMFDMIPKFNGVVIKTIGDAVMASFKSSEEGINAALSIRNAFNEFNSDPQTENDILVKVGIHTGPTIMVNLNSRIDYFGKTVNMAARIQGQANNNEIIISEEIRKDPAVAAVLKKHIKSFYKKQAALKGIEGFNTLYILNLG